MIGFKFNTFDYNYILDMFDSFKSLLDDDNVNYHFKHSGDSEVLITSVGIDLSKEYFKKTKIINSIEHIDFNNKINSTNNPTNFHKQNSYESGDLEYITLNLDRGIVTSSIIPHDIFKSKLKHINYYITLEDGRYMGLWSKIQKFDAVLEDICKIRKEKTRQYVNLKSDVKLFKKMLSVYGRLNEFHTKDILNLDTLDVYTVQSKRYKLFTGQRTHIYDRIIKNIESKESYTKNDYKTVRQILHDSAYDKHKVKTVLKSMKSKLLDTSTGLANMYYKLFLI